ncbi:MAG: hypothetical protein V4795_22445 [Pseudomonadota bacterium]
MYANKREQFATTWLTAGVFFAFFATLVMWVAVLGRKRHARNRCNILFLRGFHQEARANVPNLFLPSIGCYGRVLRLLNVVKIVDAGAAGVLTDAADQPAPGDRWKVELQALLVQSDVAVIDFSVPSENLYWEVDQALTYLTANRIVLISELSKFASPNYLALRQRFPSLDHAPSPIPIYPSRFVVPLRIWKWWFFQFERRLHSCMLQIADRL